MAFQSTVNLYRAPGVPGNLAFSGPIRAKEYTLVSADAAYNIIGATAFTVTSEGIAAAGGTNDFAGILVDTHINSSNGTSAGGPLAATLTLPNYSQGTLAKMGEFFVTLPAAAAIGDLVTYNTTTGALATLAPAIAGTATQSTTVVTVATSTGANIGVGSKITLNDVTMTVLALGTGTGGTGTYTVDYSQTVGTAAAFTGTSVPASGFALVPNAKVDNYTVAAAGVGCIKLTN